MLNLGFAAIIFIDFAQLRGAARQMIELVRPSSPDPVCLLQKLLSAKWFLKKIGISMYELVQMLVGYELIDQSLEWASLSFWLMLEINCMI